MARDDEERAVRRPVRDRVVARNLPDGLRLRAGLQALHEYVEVRPVSPGGRIGDAAAVGGEAAEVVDGVGRAGQIPFLTVAEHEELRPLVAPDVHAEDEAGLGRRVVDARDPLVVEGELIRPRQTAGRDLPGLRNTGDVRQERDAAPVRGPGSPVGGADLQVAVERVGQGCVSLCVGREPRAS
jgi:hypothetical protein